MLAWGGSWAAACCAGWAEGKIGGGKDLGLRADFQGEGGGEK